MTGAALVSNPAAANEVANADQCSAGAQRAAVVGRRNVVVATATSEACKQHCHGPWLGKLEHFAVPKHQALDDGSEQQHRGAPGDFDAIRLQHRDDARQRVDAQRPRHSPWITCAGESAANDQRQAGGGCDDRRNEVPARCRMPSRVVQNYCHRDEQPDQRNERIAAGCCKGRLHQWRRTVQRPSDLATEGVKTEQPGYQATGRRHQVAFGQIEPQCQRGE